MLAKPFCNALKYSLTKKKLNIKIFYLQTGMNVSKLSKYFY